LFHPAAAAAGPDLHAVFPKRRTYMTYMKSDEPYTDDRTKNGSIKNSTDVVWSGYTMFPKQPETAFLKHENINEVFLQLLNTSCQGGMITLF